MADSQDLEKKAVAIVPLLRKALVNAIGTFNRVDGPSLLQPRKTPSGYYVKANQLGWGAASERAIAHRLAFYLECELRRSGIVAGGAPISVDCEYNRHLEGMKTHRIPGELVDIVKKAKRKAVALPDGEDLYRFSISPDIVVHERGSDANNLLVIELKKQTNDEIPEYDELKLKCFTKNGEDDYGYMLGFVVTALDNIEPEDRELILATPYAGGVAQNLSFGAT
jgi:hypothetical protein